MCAADCVRLPDNRLGALGLRRRLRLAGDQGFGSYFLTLPYGGIKMAAAVFGAVAGGMGLIFIRGDKLTADKIWGPAMGGEYVITPEHIRGEKDLHFFGQAQGQ